MQVKDNIPGVCNNSKIIAIISLPGNGQVKAIAPLTDEEIEKKLNSEVTFLKTYPDYNDKGMVNLIVNCEGEMVSCKIDNKTKSPELDKEIVKVFSILKTWEPGTLNGNPVDTSILYSFTIKNGKIFL